MNNKNKEALVSVGLPVYNGEETIQYTLNCLLAQTYRSIEIIISDNNSKDNTYSICANYAKNDKRIKLLKNNRNLGVTKNFKIVSQEAKGEYFFWAAADDHWSRDFISTMVKILKEHTNASIVLPSVKRVDDNGNFIDILRFIRKDDPQQMGAIQRAMSLLSLDGKIKNKKYNLFLCGMMRATILKKTIEEYPFILGERPLVAAMGIDYKIIYTDQQLMTKTVHLKPFKDRHPDDPYSIGKKAKDIWNNRLLMSKYFFSASIISIHSKLTVVPIIIAICLIQTTIKWCKTIIINTLPSLWVDKLKSLKNMILKGNK